MIYNDNVTYTMYYVLLYYMLLSLLYCIGGISKNLRCTYQDENTIAHFCSCSYINKGKRNIRRYTRVFKLARIHTTIIEH